LPTANGFLLEILVIVSHFYYISIALLFQRKAVELDSTSLPFCAPLNRENCEIFIANQEISATFKQHICDMQFNVVAVALKS
jgi:hypothetical protein